MSVTPEEMFSQLLGLGKSWRVVRTEFEEKSAPLVICVEERAELWSDERQRAGTAVSCYDHVEPMQWRHLNVSNKECVIVCALPRGRRRDDGKIYRVTLPWEGRNKHFTQKLEAFALTLMREMPVKRAGEILGESDQRMWRMLLAHVDEAYARLSFEEVVWVGADEMNRRKGHSIAIYRTAWTYTVWVLGANPRSCMSSRKRFVSSVMVPFRKRW